MFDWASAVDATSITVLQATKYVLTSLTMGSLLRIAFMWWEPGANKRVHAGRHGRSGPVAVSPFFPAELHSYLPSSYTLLGMVTVPAEAAC